MAVRRCPLQRPGNSDSAVDSQGRALDALREGDWEAGGRYDTGTAYSGNLFFVPDDTLIMSEASYLGIHSHADLFGGVVPHPVVKTKAITHPLVTTHADRPDGWSPIFARKIKDSALPGYTAFSAQDARLAAMRLLARGEVRVKDASRDGGKGQAVHQHQRTRGTS